MIASDSTKGQSKVKRIGCLIIQKPLENIRKIFQEKERLKSVSVQDIKPIVLDEIIPKERVEEESHFLPTKSKQIKQKIEPPQIIQSNQVERPSIDKKTKLTTLTPSFVEIEKVEFNIYEKEPQEMERLIEYKKNVEENQIFLPKIENIEFDFIFQQTELEKIPKENFIEIKEKKVQSFEKEKKVQPSEIKINFENFEPINISPLEKNPREVNLNLENKKVFILPQLYFENFEKIEIKKPFFESFPSIVESKINDKKIEKEIKETKKESETFQRINDTLEKKKIFEIPEIEKYFEVGEKQRLEKREKEKEIVPQTIKINKMVSLEYKECFYNYVNLAIKVDSFQRELVNDYRFGPYHKAKELEELYWGIVNSKDKENYEKEKQKFLEALKKCNEKEGKLTEQMIVLTKAIGLLKIITEEKNDEVLFQALTMYKQILEKYPQLKKLIEYEFSKYVFVKTFSEDKIGPGQEINEITKELSTEIKNLCFAQWASFLDHVIEKGSSKELRFLCAEEYTKIIIEKPEIDKEIKDIKIIKKQIENFFFGQENKIELDPVLENIVIYEIVFLIDNFNKRRE